MEYIWILVWIGLMALVAGTMQFKRTVLVDGVEEERYSWFFALIAFLPIILMAGFRDRWFADTSLYVSSYSEMPLSISGIPQYLNAVTKDRGFSALSCLLRLVFKDNFRSYLIVIAAIQGIILVKFFQKYSNAYLVSVFLFVASTDYLSWMFNGMRQFTAVVIVLCSTPFLLKKKWVPTILLILLASTMHQSALLMIPIVFIVQGEAWNKRTLLFIALVLVAVVFLDSFTNILDDTLQGTQYENVVNDYTEWNDDGTNPIRVLVYAVPTILAVFGRKRLADSNNTLINICVNMSIVSTGLYIVSMFTSGVFIGRLPIYCSLFGYILLPWEISNLFEKETRKGIFPVMIMLYLGFYYYQLNFAWSTI